MEKDLGALQINESTGAGEQQKEPLSLLDNENALVPPPPQKRPRVMEEKSKEQQPKPTVAELVNKMEGINNTLNDLNTKFQGFAINSYKKDLDIEKAMAMLENKIMNQLGKMEETMSTAGGGGKEGPSTSSIIQQEKKDDMAWLLGSSAEEPPNFDRSRFDRSFRGNGRGRVHKHFNKFSRGKFFNRRY